MMVETNEGAGSAFLAFLLGAILLVVAVIGFFLWDNDGSGGGYTAAPGPIHIIIKKP